MRLITILLVMSFILIYPAAAQDEDELPFGSDLQAVLDETLAEYNGFGVTAAVIVPGYDMWVGTSGISHDTVPITPDSVFHAGSIGKNFTATLVLQLAEEGVLSLDDPIGEWLPDYPNVDPTITIRQLLNHTGGVFNVTKHDEFWEEVFTNPTRVWTYEETILTYVQEPDFAPGEGWEYSNSGYLLLGIIIENATGSDVATELRSRFLEPLGMNRTYIPVVEEIPEPFAHGWLSIGNYVPSADDDETLDDILLLPATALFSAAGSAAEIATTAGDLAIWINALYHEKTILSEDTLDQMLDFVAPPDDPEYFIVEGYGLGAWQVNPELVGGAIMYGHGGDIQAYKAGAMYMPEYDVSFGLLINWDNDEAQGVFTSRLVEVLKQNLDQP